MDESEFPLPLDRGHGAGRTRNDLAAIVALESCDSQPSRRAVQRQGRSLLAVGVLEVVGQFGKGEAVVLRDPDGKEFARGLTNYRAEDVRKIKGLRTSEIAHALGHCPYDEVIHRDNMVVTV